MILENTCYYDAAQRLRRRFGLDRRGEIIPPKIYYYFFQLVYCCRTTTKVDLTRKHKK